MHRCARLPTGLQTAAVTAPKMQLFQSEPVERVKKESVKAGQKVKNAAPSLPSAPSVNLPSLGFNTSLLTLPRKFPVLTHALYQFWCLGRMLTMCV